MRPPVLYVRRRERLRLQKKMCKCSELMGRIPSYLLLTPLASFTLTRRFAATSPIKGEVGAAIGMIEGAR